MFICLTRCVVCHVGGGGGGRQGDGEMGVVGREIRRIGSGGQGMGKNRVGRGRERKGWIEEGLGWMEARADEEKGEGANFPIKL